MRLVLIGLAGAVGVLLRYGLTAFLPTAGGSPFPWTILVINAAGSLLLGLINGLATGRGLLPPVWREPLTVGLIGSFTTFSTWMVDTDRLLEQGRGWAAAANIGGSTLLGLAAAWGGLELGCALARQGGRPPAETGIALPAPDEGQD